MATLKRNDCDVFNCAPKKCNNESDVLLNCITGACVDRSYDTDCSHSKCDNVPLGITIIPGSGNLIEFPVTKNTNDISEGNGFLDCIKNVELCPKIFSPTDICIQNCAEFAAVSQINFINGNLIIGDFSDNLPPNISLNGSLPLSNSDAIDIFPNLLGINGSIYIVASQYKIINGFEKLRYVTGSIVIVNNPHLISIPTFSNLLSVGGQIIGKNCCNHVSDVSNNNDPDAPSDYLTPQCGKGAIIIANNNVLRKIDGFETIRQIKDGIFIANNQCLRHICAFIHLYRTDRIVISSNDKLSKIIGFCYTDTINIGLYILDNNIEGEFDFTISAFITLETAGDIVIIGNNNMKVLKFDTLKIVNDFIIRSNIQLSEFTSSVEYAKSLYIENNSNLCIIRLSCLQEIINFLNINCNNSLQCIDSFDELRRVGHGIIISENKQLSEIKSFNKLKYIGSTCILLSKVEHNNNPCAGCGCLTSISFDWTSIVRSNQCNIIDPFLVYSYDGSIVSCTYVLPCNFFKFVCNTNNNCCDSFLQNEEIPDILSYSLIIYGNQRLKAIGGFCNLKHIETNIYIINNTVLHTINAFGQLASVLDLWIRNNPSLKYIIGFSNLLSCRDLVLYESVCLCDFSSIKSLEFAQYIAIEAKTAKTVKYPKSPIPSVVGYVLYYSYDNNVK